MYICSVAGRVVGSAPAGRWGGAGAHAAAVAEMLAARRPVAVTFACARGRCDAEQYIPILLYHTTLHRIRD
jgi:hypothetical protein